MLMATPSLACTERRTYSATLAARETRRQAFLAEQEAVGRDLLRARLFRGELVLERPTVVAFYPERQPGSDSVALRQRISQYADEAEDVEWSFEERYSGEFQLTDARSHALYAVSVSPDSVGLLLAAPGYPPVVWYGEIAGGELRERLSALSERLPGRAVVSAERL